MQLRSQRVMLAMVAMLAAIITTSPQLAAAFNPTCAVVGHHNAASSSISSSSSSSSSALPGGGRPAFSVEVSSTRLCLRNDNDDDGPVKSRSKRKRVFAVVKSVSFYLTLLLGPTTAVVTTRPPTAHAMMGTIPRRPDVSRLEDNPEDLLVLKKDARGRLLPPDFSSPLYQGRNGDKMKELHTQMYEDRLRLQELQDRQAEQRRQEQPPPPPPKEDDTATDRPAAVDDPDALLQLRALQAAAGSDATTAPPTSSSSRTVTAAPKSKATKKSKTSKQQAREVTITALEYSGYLAAGVAVSKFLSRKEAKKVKKGLEIFESQRAEFFNITGKADSDEDLADELADKRGNTTATDDDDDDDDEYDGDVPPEPKKPSGGSPPPPPPPPAGGSPTPPTPPSSDSAKASDDDIERMKRLFDK